MLVYIEYTKIKKLNEEKIDKKYAVKVYRINDSKIDQIPSHLKLEKVYKEQDPRERFLFKDID